MTELLLEETQPWAAIAWELPSSLKSLTIGRLETNKYTNTVIMESVESGVMS